MSSNSKGRLAPKRPGPLNDTERAARKEAEAFWIYIGGVPADEDEQKRLERQFFRFAGCERRRALREAAKVAAQSERAWIEATDTPGYVANRISLEILALGAKRQEPKATTKPQPMKAKRVSGANDGERRK